MSTPWSQTFNFHNTELFSENKFLLNHSVSGTSLWQQTNTQNHLSFKNQIIIPVMGSGWTQDHFLLQLHQNIKFKSAQKLPLFSILSGAFLLHNIHKLQWVSITPTLGCGPRCSIISIIILSLKSEGRVFTSLVFYECFSGRRLIGFWLVSALVSSLIPNRERVRLAI